MKILLLFLLGFFFTSEVTAFNKPYPKSPAKYARTTPVKATPGYRLPQNVILEQQNVTIEPFFATKSFDGVSTITGNVTQVTENITLHSRNLDIIIAKIFVNFKEVTSQVEASYDLEKDFVVMKFGYELQVEDHFEMEFRYQGRISENNRGLYFAKYLTIDEDERQFLVTQMGLTHAREVFPCFDEPSFKAIFNLKIIRERKYSTLSNAALESTVEAPM